jgi:uncharacterized RDD family membrane protein YckC
MNVEPNPYSPPQAEVADPGPAGGAPELAPRGLRLGGAILDTLAVTAITVPTMYFAGYWAEVMAGRQPGIATQLGWTAFGFAVFLLVHGYFLYRGGQTLAKRVLDMKIVDMQGRKPPFLRLVGLRYFLPQLMYIVPLLGPIVALVGILLILRDDRRPLHDHIAGTRVVVAR